MIKKMLQKTKQYLEKTLSKNGKYLLALSGGADSIALFYLLLEGKWNFQVCHVNHGWRKESFSEEVELKTLCETHNIGFNLYRIEPNQSDMKNAEDKARQKRLSFFEKIYKENDFDGLFLGHHADDQVETILKRVFEGSFLSYISGMKVESIFNGMRVFRPLIFVYKSEIYEYLKSEKREFFEDATNRDPKFLRSRMRIEMVPYLEEVFGKGIRENILLLASRIDSCMHYIERQAEAKSLYVHKGPIGYYLATSLLTEQVEAEVLLREIFQKEKIDLSRGEIEKLIFLAKSAKDQKKVSKGDWNLVVERDHLFVCKLPKSPSFSVSKLPLYRPLDDWKGVFQGSSAIYFPEEGCYLAPPILNKKLPNGMELKEWYRIHKVPVFLRSWVPVIWSQGEIVGDCLSGKSCLSDNPLYANHLLTLKYE
ncbi:MAG: tRNA lysidine(34) synthetase TilS [Chlamydiae bacterium]|nr:tRNA lysidine(34) synthetase TilS [Chlamydiota bacterium]